MSIGTNTILEEVATGGRCKKEQKMSTVEADDEVQGYARIKI